MIASHFERDVRSSLFIKIMRILIKNAFIITQNDKRENIPRGFVMIKNDKLEMIGAGDPKERDILKCHKIIDAKNLVVMPGLINAHVHLGESIYKDFFNGNYTLEGYLKKTECLTRKTDLIEKGRGIIGDYSLLNLLKSGATTICGGRTTDLAEKWGIRNVSGYMVMDSFKLKKFTEGLEEKYYEEYKKIRKTRLSYLSLFIHSLNTFNVSMIGGVKKILKKYPKTRLILHVAETKKQENEIKNKFGKSSIMFLHQNDLLNDRTILIHGNWIDNKDLKIFKKSKASLVHCLSSNLKVADRTLNLKKIVRSKIKSCIATDGVVTSGTFDILGEAKKCFIYHNRGSRINNGQLNYQKILDLITIDAAEVLGLKNDIGSIEKGKKADIVLIEQRSSRKNIAESIIEDKYTVRGVVIDGKLKMWNSRILITDEKKVMNKFRTLTKEIREKVQ